MIVYVGIYDAIAHKRLMASVFLGMQIPEANANYYVENMKNAGNSNVCLFTLAAAHTYTHSHVFITIQPRVDYDVYGINYFTLKYFVSTSVWHGM